jgi:3-isopropylmalate/(R)-2-methylmalate dehydratase small subunit
MFKSIAVVDMRVKAIKYDKKNINTDLIIPARYLVTSEASFLGQHCLEDLDPDFVKKVKQNEYDALVTNSNFGCGSSREQAAIAIKAAGINCVIAPSFSRIFLRNAINTGLAVIKFDKIENINTGDSLEIDFKEGVIMNQTRSLELYFKKFPPFLQMILQQGGLVNYIKNYIRNE